MGAACSEDNEDQIRSSNTTRKRAGRASKDVVETETETECIPQQFEKALRTGDEALAMRLVDEHHDIDFMHMVLSNGLDCLQMAARSNRQKLILFFLEERADPKFKNLTTGSTALFGAVQESQLHIAVLLMQHDVFPQLLYSIKSIQSPHVI